MEHDKNNYKPKFDLIIGTQTMKELGIILYFSTNMIKIDKIQLPMRKIKEPQKPNHIYQMYKNQRHLHVLTQMYSKLEPESTKALADVQAASSPSWCQKWHVIVTAF